MSIRIALVGECRLWLECLERSLGAFPALSAAGVLTSMEIQQRRVTGNAAEVVVVELPAQVPGAISMLEEVQQWFPSSRFLAIVKSANALFLRSILEAGVLSCVHADQPLGELARGIELTATGQSFITPHLSRQLLSNVLSAGERSPLDRLSPRERTVLLQLLQGRANKEIAERLRLSVRTIETHRAHVMNKLGVHSVVELFQFAVSHDLLPSQAVEAAAGTA